LFARIGATTGKTCHIDQPIRGVFGSYLIRFQPTEGNIDTKFLYFYTQSRVYWLYVNKSKEGQLKKGLNSKSLGNFKLPLPPLPEQRRIADILSTVDKKLELERKRKAKLERIKKGLMNDLLTGKKRVNVKVAK
jgi:type I restriction enzyme S subunit